jgi:hypothetical protein
LPAPDIFQDALFEIAGFEGNDRFLEWNAGNLHGDPRPKRPGGIVLVAENEVKHPPPPREREDQHSDGI